MSIVDEIGDIIRKENINNDELLSKAREIERLMRLKVPAGSLKKGEVCRSIIAIDFASKILQITISKSSLMSYAPVGKKIYNDTFLACKMLLNLHIPNSMTIETLSLKYGHDRIIHQAKSLLHTFLRKTKSLDLQEHILHTVAFFVTAKNHQIYITKQKYLLDNELNPVEFKRIHDEFEVRLKAKEIHFNFEGEFDLTIPTTTSTTNRLNVPLDGNKRIEPHESQKVGVSSTSTPTLTSTTPSLTTPINEILSRINNNSSTTNEDFLAINENNNSNNNNNRYRSINSKRVFESMSGSSSTSCCAMTDEENMNLKKKQMTERVYQIWKQQVQQRIQQQNQ